MAKYYAPNFSGLLPLFDGKSAAGGKLYAYRAGSSIPVPLFDEDGVELGSWVSIDSNGCADFLLDSSISYKLVVKDSLGAVVGEWDNVKATNAPGGMDNPMEEQGDLIVGGTGGTAERLGVGSAGQVLTSDGTTASWAAPATQPGDHQLLVSATDAAAGYLGAKLTAGSNITITPQTDGDGVQTLEISATGGGGGGASDWREVLPATNRSYQVSSQASGLVRRFYPLGPTVRSVMVMTANYKVGATCKGHIRIYKMQIPNGSTESAEATATMTSIAHKEFTLTVKSGVIWVSFDADVDVSNTSYQYFYAIGFNNSANPNPSDYLKFQLSAAVSTSGTALYPVEFHVSTNKLIDSTTSNTLGYTAGDYTYVSGISSKVES